MDATQARIPATQIPMVMAGAMSMPSSWHAWRYDGRTHSIGESEG